MDRSARLTVGRIGTAPSLEMSSTGGARNATPFRSECDEGRAGKEKMLRQGSCCASEPHVALSAAL